MLNRSLLLRKKFALSTFIASCFVLVPYAANAANYYCDNNGTTAGFGKAGATWVATTLNQGNANSTGVAALGASITTLKTDNITDAVNLVIATTGLAAGTDPGHREIRKHDLWDSFRSNHAFGWNNQSTGQLITHR